MIDKMWSLRREKPLDERLLAAYNTNPPAFPELSPDNAAKLIGNMIGYVKDGERTTLSPEEILRKAIDRYIHRQK